MRGKGVLLGGHGRSWTPLLWGSLLFMHTPFDAELPNFTW